MDRKKYLSTVESMRDDVKLWRMLTFGSMISTIFLSMFILMSDFQEKIIITPVGGVGVCGDFSVTGDTYDAAGIECYARHFANLRLTYHRDNARTKFKEFIKHSNPMVYSALRADLEAEADNIERNQIGSVFHIMKTHIQGNKATLTGEHIGLIGSRVVSEKKRFFEIIFQSNGGRLTVKSFGELSLDKAGDLKKIEIEEKTMVDSPDLEPTATTQERAPKNESTH